MRTKALLFLTFGLACQKQPTEPQLKQAPDDIPVKTTAPVAVEEPGDAGGDILGNPVPAGMIVLDEDRLKHFLGYQVAMTDVNMQISKESRPLQVPAADGGYRTDPDALEKASALMKRETDSRGKAVQAAGLTAPQIRQIERMVAEFLGQRMVANTGNQGLMVQQLEEMMQQVPANQRGEFEQALKQARTQQAASNNLSSLRRHYGDANVDLLLKHEAELRARWQAMAAGLAGAMPR